jgi:hypothetical protein
MNPIPPRPLPPLPPVLEPPTVYRTTPVERVRDYVAALISGGFGLFLASVAATTPRTLIALEWFFVLLVAVVCLGFGVSRVMRARIEDRIAVTREGFTFRAPFREMHIAWRDVAGVDFAPMGDGNFDVQLREGVRPGFIRIDVAGLDPPGREFWRQLYRFAPDAISYEPSFVRFLRKLGWRPKLEKMRTTRASAQEMPDFEAMRADARTVLTGKDLEDVLADLDQLEREWKKRI